MNSYQLRRTMDTYNALCKISGHELEETDLACTHVFEVVVILPLPAALTPLVNHLQCKNRALSQHKSCKVSMEIYLSQSIHIWWMEGDEGRKSTHLAHPAFSGRHRCSLFTLMLTRECFDIGETWEELLLVTVRLDLCFGWRLVTNCSCPLPLVTDKRVRVADALGFPSFHCFGRWALDVVLPHLGGR